MQLIGNINMTIFVGAYNYYNKAQKHQCIIMCQIINSTNYWKRKYIFKVRNNVLKGHNILFT